MKNVPTFQQFWDAYGLKRDRLRAERAWNRLAADDKRNAIAAIAAYREDCDRRGISRMYAQGYLNARRWEDDFADLLADKSKLPKGSVGNGTAVAKDPSPTPPHTKTGMMEW